MKNLNYRGIELLPLSVTEATRVGDIGAVERVLWYYSGHMNKLCIRTLYDENDCLYMCLDEVAKHHLGVKLIHTIVTS